MEEKMEKKRIQMMKENENKRRKLWILIARKEIPKVSMTDICDIEPVYRFMNR